MSQGTVAARHLLVKHQKSRNPVSRNPAFKNVNIKERTVEWADNKLLEYIKQIKESKNSEEEFKKLALKYSDCGSYKNGGDLGEFSYNQMLKPFSEATFKLKVGEMSDIVHSDSGSHIIWRYK